MYDHIAGEPFEPREGDIIDIDGERWDYIDGEWTSEEWLTPPLMSVECYDFNIVIRGK